VQKHGAAVACGAASRVHMRSSRHAMLSFGAALTPSSVSALFAFSSKRYGF
jgi:hypothetical protein